MWDSSSCTKLGSLAFAIPNLWRGGCFEVRFSKSKSKTRIIFQIRCRERSRSQTHRVQQCCRQGGACQTVGQSINQSIYQSINHPTAVNSRTSASTPRSATVTQQEWTSYGRAHRWSPCPWRAWRAGLPAVSCMLLVGGWLIDWLIDFRLSRTGRINAGRLRQNRR